MARDVHNDEGQMRGVSIEQEPVALFFVSGFSGLYFLILRMTIYTTYLYLRAAMHL